MATKREEKISAQITGKGCPPTIGLQRRGQPKCLAARVPRKAPMKPRAMEPKQPRFLLPPRRAPMDPIREAITNRISRDRNDMAIFLQKNTLPARDSEERCSQQELSELPGMKGIPLP